jgi:trk system potassium uptake protein TrkA
LYIVVAGSDETAIRMVESLMDNHDVVFLVTSASHAARLDRLDIQIVEGSATSATALTETRAHRADFFIAATASDEANLVACLTAARLGAKRTICILTATAGLRWAESDDTSLADSVGIDIVLRPAQQLADEIVSIVTVPGALDVRSFREGRVRLLESVVEEEALLTVQPIGAQELPRGVRLVMARRAHDFLVPGADTVLAPGDRVIATGTRRSLERFYSHFVRSPGRGKEKRRAIVAGGGSVGSLVARGLTEAGWWVKLIEADQQRCEELASTLDCLVLHGDGSDLDLLQEERIDSTAALIAVTNNDEKNLLISLLAKHAGVPRIITRADRLTNERMFETVGIDVVLSARGAAIRSVCRDIVEANREHLADLEHGDIEVLELELPDDFVRTRLPDVKPPTLAGVGAILRGRRTIIPRDKHDLRPGDHVLVVCLTAQEQATREYFLKHLGRAAPQAAH